jgi:hypothetical protein
MTNRKRENDLSEEEKKDLAKKRKRTKVKGAKGPSE